MIIVVALASSDSFLISSSSKKGVSFLIDNSKALIMLSLDSKLKKIILSENIKDLCDGKSTAITFSFPRKYS